jgi:O-antigen/teichoic acid export membrane protein
MGGFGELRRLDRLPQGTPVRGTVTVGSVAMRGRWRDSSALAAGSIVTGLLAYLFFAIATRTLGPTLAAPVSVLWTYWSFSAAAVTFPIQHWMARAAVVEGEGSVRAGLPSVAGLVVLVALVVTALSWWGRDDLFGRSDAWFPLLVGGVTIGSGFVGAVRGGLVARRRFTSLAWALVAENATRCVAAIGLALAQVRSAAAYGLALMVGAAACFRWVSVLRFAPEPARSGRTSPVRLLGGSAGGSLLGQTVLTGGPVVLTLSGGSASQVTALFAGLALFRAPYLVALGLVSQLTGRLTGWVVAEDWHVLRRLRALLVAVTLLACGAGAAVGAWLGPPLLQLIFGADVVLSSSVSAVVAAASVVALSNLVISVALIAHSRAGSVAGVWCVGIAVAAAYFAWSDQSPLDRTVAAFLIAETAAFATGVAQDWRLTPRRPR